MLGLLAGAVLVFRMNQAALDGYWISMLRNLQAGAGGPVGRHPGPGRRARQALPGQPPAYLWRTRRWGRYLTLVAAAVLLIPELYDSPTACHR